MTKPAKLPEWDTTKVNTIEPDQDHKDGGWLAPDGVPEKPPFQTFNWWQNNVYDWLAELNKVGLLGYDSGTDYIATFSFAVGSDGNLYRAVANNGPGSSVVDPVTDDGTTWERADNSPVIPQNGGGALTAFRINELQDGNTYTLPSANSVGANGWLLIELPDKYSASQPLVQRLGSDTITDIDGTDTEILFDSGTSIAVRLISDGVSDWRI